MARSFSGGLFHGVYETGAGVGERTARNPEPRGLGRLEWLLPALLVVLATAAALVVLRAQVPVPTEVAAADTYGGMTPGTERTWGFWDLVQVLLPWSIPLVIGGAGLTDSRFIDRRGAVVGVLLIGLAGCVATSFFDLLGSGDDPSRWLALVYLLRFGFATQVLVGVVLWIHLCHPRHRTALNAALAATVAAALPLFFTSGGKEVLQPLWHQETVWLSFLPVAALVLMLALLPTGLLLVGPGQGWDRNHNAFRAVFALGLLGLTVSVWQLVKGEDAPTWLSLWPVFALAACFIAAVMTGRTGGLPSVSGAMLAMAVGLAALPAALFAWDRTATNPGLGLDADDSSSSVLWLLAMIAAGVAGAVLARFIGVWALALAAVALVLAEIVGADTGLDHQLAIRCAAAGALGALIGVLRPEAAVAALGLNAACGPVWPQLQAAEKDYGWISHLTDKPGGIPVALLVMAALAVVLALAATVFRPSAGQAPRPTGR